MADQQESNIKQENNVARTGLNMDQTLNQVQKGQLTYALNAAVENFDSNSVNYQNEPGNELCLNFPANYRLIGTHAIVEQNKHIFFLTNPDTGASEIGYMDNNDCIYHTLVNAKCLNFKINHPIHKVVHKITNCSTEIYWTDGFNPRRYLDINDIPKILKWGSPLCSPIYTDEVDCNQLRIQPNFTIPQLSVSDVTNTGNLISGTYQFAAQYSDASGNPYTSYYSVTNPMPIADIQISTPNFNYPVGKSIIIDVSNLDSTGQFEYFNVAVIKTINAITSVELIGTYFIEQDNRQITYTGQIVDNIRLSINDIFEKFPYYDIAQDLTTAQDILIWDQLSAIDRINYQQIANKISLQWETWRIPATENYADEINATNLRGYLRDEVYAFEIVFLLGNGKETDGFHIPGRERSFSENRPDIADTHPDFIGEPEPGTHYSPYWKIYNTASIIGLSPEYTTDSTYKGAYQYGEFAYWESTDEYPCNTDVWGELAGKKIRHHKFPDVLVSPIYESKVFSTVSSMVMGDDAVFPIGVKVNVQQLHSLINSSSLTTEQKDDIVGFKIVRGDRGTNKSIIAKGILRNVGTYTKDEKDYYFPNYPYNDLKEDPFINITNNAYSDSCGAFNVTITALGTNPSGGPDIAKLQYTVCNANVSDSIIYYETGEQASVCSIGKPVIIIGEGTVSYANYDVWRIAGVRGCNGWEVEYNDITEGIKTEWVNGKDDFEVRVVIGSVPVCINGCDNHGWCKNSVIIHQLGGSYINNSNCSIINNDPLPAVTDRYRQIFNSPETSFGQPFLGNVLKIESVIYGAGKAHFVEVKDNAKYRLVSEQAQRDALDSSAAMGGSTDEFNIQAMFAAYQAYLTIYINGITRKNYAYSFNSIASYDYSNDVPNDAGVKQRTLDIAKYLIPAVISTGDDKDINNWNRETSVYLKTDDGKTALPFPDSSPDMLSGGASIITDDSRFTISQVNHCTTPEKQKDIQVVSYYASLKNTFVNQWGQVYSYDTIDTGFQEIFEGASTYATVFGGDTFISRFAFKTKIPFFIDNRVDAPDDSDIFYDEIGNIAYPKYWHSSRSILDDYSVPPGEADQSLGILVNFISYKAHNFDCPNDTSIVTTIPATSTTTTSTTKQPKGIVTTGDAERTFYDGYFYLFAYGIPYFYCESSYNTDLRQAFNNKEGDFWPHVSNTIPDDWVQEHFVSIANDNTYYYNTTFSKQNKENYFSHLPADWDGDVCLTNYPFRAIYSDPQSVDSDNRVNNWRIYRAVSYFDFPQNYGPLTSLDGIQNRAILARFHNKTQLYGNLLTLDTSNPQAAYLGNPTLFKGAPPIDFADTDLGYAGSQHKMLLKIPHGQISIDAKRGSIFLIQGTEATDISGFGSGMNRFLTENLNFELQRAFPTVDIDNHFHGVGLHAVYDSKYERVIITKLDYSPLDSNIVYSNNEFYLDEKLISLQDTEYFCNKSWTLSYNMNTKSWISFHSYLPNWYIGESNFFYSGLNGCCDDFDFIAAELPSNFNCDLWGAAILDGCEPLCELEGYACLQTTTTTTSTSSTTTSTTTLYPPCALEGEAQDMCYTTSTTTSTTTECIRPEGLRQLSFITGHTFGGITVDSTDSAAEACYEMHWLIDTPIITPNYIFVEQDTITGQLYLLDGTRNCECNIPDGWYFTDESASGDYVFHVENCFITETYSCATTTTSTTDTPTTTTTTTRAWECDLEGEAYDVCTTTTTSTTQEPTTTTTSTTSEPTTTTSTTCYLGIVCGEVICANCELALNILEVIFMRFSKHIGTPTKQQNGFVTFCLLLQVLL